MIQRTPQQLAEQRAERDALAEKVRLQLKNKAPGMIFTAGQLTLIDEWITATDPTIDLSEAIRRLVELGLKSKGK